MASNIVERIMLGYLVSLCVLVKLSDARMFSSISRIQNLFSSANADRFEASSATDIDTLDTGLDDIYNLNFPLAPTPLVSTPRAAEPSPSIPYNQPVYPAPTTIPPATLPSPPPLSTLPPPPSMHLSAAPYPSTGRPQGAPSSGAGAPKRGKGKGRRFKVWCVAKPTVPDSLLQRAMDYACGFGGADCSEIQPNGSCFDPNSLVAHASFAFNSYWQKSKSAGGTCDFGGTAMLVTVDPSFKDCRFAMDNNA